MLAAQSFRFARAFSDGPNTPHAFPGILAGRSALLSRKLGLFDVSITLAEHLQRHGYNTIGFNAANPYLSRHFRYDRGFAYFQDYIELDTDSLPNQRHLQRNQKHAPHGQQAASRISIPALDIEQYALSEASIRAKASLENQFTADVCKKLRQRSGAPFFLWVHYMDCHYPYLPQPEWQTALGIAPISREENRRLNVHVRENMALSPDDLARLRNLYAAAVRQLDARVGELLRELQERELLDDALLIFTADHGEEFMEHGDLQHKSKLYDELLHVPLMIKRPFQREGAVVQDMVSLLQLAPAIADLAYLKNPFMHHPLFRKPAARPVFSAASYGANGGPPVEGDMFRTDCMPKVYGCRSERYKVVYDTGRKRYRAFNLLEDPPEQRSRDQNDDNEARRLAGLLASRVQELEKMRLREQVGRLRQESAILELPHAV